MKSNKVLKLLNITRPTLSRYVKEKLVKYKVQPNGFVVFFNWQPTDRGGVFQPNSTYQNEIFLI